MTPADLRELAEGLTDAQRRALIDAMPAVAANTVWLHRGHGNTLMKLWRLGLTDFDRAPARLTSKGKALRNHLLGQSHG